MKNINERLSYEFAENYQRIMVYTRSEVRKETAVKYTKLLIDVLDNRISNNEMCDILIDKFQWQADSLKRERGTAVICFGEYEYRMIKVLTCSLLRYLNDKRYDTAYLLADALHVLPEVLLSGDGNSRNSFYQSFIKPYTRKTGDKLLEKYKEYFYKKTPKEIITDRIFEAIKLFSAVLTLILGSIYVFIFCTTGFYEKPPGAVISRDENCIVYSMPIRSIGKAGSKGYNIFVDIKCPKNGYNADDLTEKMCSAVDISRVSMDNCYPNSSYYIDIKVDSETKHNYPIRVTEIDRKTTELDECRVSVGRYDTPEMIKSYVKTVDSIRAEKIIFDTGPPVSEYVNELNGYCSDLSPLSYEDIAFLEKYDIEFHGTLLLNNDTFERLKADTLSSAGEDPIPKVPGYAQYYGSLKFSGGEWVFLDEAGKSHSPLAIKLY